MPNIVGARIDNRLIHAQVSGQWTKALGANLLLVANDAVSKSQFRQGLMNLAAPGFVQTRFFSLDKTIQTIHKASPSQKILLLVESAQDALRLVQGGVPISSFNVANISSQLARHIITPTVSVDDEELAALRQLHALGIHLDFQKTPQMPKQDFGLLLEQFS
ncbi:MAG: PTS sugar transporter subunit IIB [Allobaculum sp.]|nr:PTS sugar transporter subunit IIB [Allobaculum sp.]